MDFAHGGELVARSRVAQVARAFDATLEGKPGLVLIELPFDVLFDTIDAPPGPDTWLPAANHRASTWPLIRKAWPKPGQYAVHCLAQRGTREWHG